MSDLPLEPEGTNPYVKIETETVEVRRGVSALAAVTIAVVLAVAAFWSAWLALPVRVAERWRVVDPPPAQMFVDRAPCLLELYFGAETTAEPTPTGTAGAVQAARESGLIEVTVAVRKVDGEDRWYTAVVGLRCPPIGVP